jgi:hypothetical protein
MPGDVQLSPAQCRIVSQGVPPRPKIRAVESVATPTEAAQLVK